MNATRASANRGKEVKNYIKKKKEKTAKLDHPCFPYRESRVLESSRTSVNPSWIVIERCESDRRTYYGGHAYRDDDLYLGGSHSLVAPSNPSTTVT